MTESPDNMGPPGSAWPQYERRPVPCPVELRIVTVVSADQEISEEQRQRVAVWLEDNGIQPNRVATGRPVTVESQIRGDQESNPIIGFTEYYEDENGSRVLNEKTRDEALTYQRWVRQRVPLGPDPNWEGWEAWRAAVEVEKGKAESP